MPHRFVDSFRAAGSGWIRMEHPHPAHFQNKFEKLGQLVGFIIRKPLQKLLEYTTVEKELANLQLIAYFLS
jgi:hypothetical protein